MIKTIVHSLSHVLFPQLCNGCGSDLITGAHLLCLKCYENLHETGFAQFQNNPVEKALWGRLASEAATAQYYFTKHSLIQQLIHQFKYKGNKDIGIFLGKLMGETLNDADRFKPATAIVPLPLFPDKERKRGYNQSALLAEGMSAAMQLPVLYNMVHRIRYTETQTHKTRMERWQNIEGVFHAGDNISPEHTNIILVDDVITTGATIEACGNALLEDIPGLKLNVVTLAYADAS
ncbi:MAG: ComF family protein [Agriterribacter sp.]